MSDVKGVGLPAARGTAARTTPSGTAPQLPRFQAPATTSTDNFPSVEGTAILNLSGEQLAGIRKQLVGMRLGRSVADEVRSEIFGILTNGQRRVLGAAWFILSVRA